jgi:hypothetical protein
MLSDVILSGPVNRNPDYAPYKKGDIEYDPHMFSAYREKGTIGVYLEVYNLLLDTSDRTNFEVTWFLQSYEEDGIGDEIMQSSLQYSGGSKDDIIFFNLSLTDIESEDYEIGIIVKDLVSEAQVRKRVKVSVR